MLIRACALTSFGILVCANSACSVLGGFEEFSPAEEVERRCGQIEHTKLDEARGAKMILIELVTETCFWVDEREVSVGQYESWINGSTFSVTVSDRYCGWKTTRNSPSTDPADECANQIPATEPTPWDLSRPIRCVDFCDARAFCKYYGADLCQTLATGGWEPAVGANEFAKACDDSGGDCNWEQTEDGCMVGAFGIRPCGPWKPVENPGKCTSSAGVWDMRGNVREWIQSCSTRDATEPFGLCQTLGGSYVDDEHTANCAAAGGRALRKDTRDRFTGFRCCTPFSE